MGTHREITRFAFISHMEDYLKQLLKDPIHADTDEFLKYHGITGPVALSMLLKKENPEDPYSAIVTRKISIKNNGVDDNGKQLPDTFAIKYSIPRKDYTKKMRNLYITLFESNIIENSPLNEGAWGYGILDNDSALDRQTVFGKYALNLLTHELKMSSDSNIMWANLGVLVDFLKKYDHEELRFTDDFNSAIELCKNSVFNLQRDKNFITSWSDKSKIKSELKRIYRDVVNISYDKERLNEEGEGGGATSADASGQFVQPLFGGPIKRKTMYITNEQEEYIKKIIEEESVVDTTIGDFGYDANPFSNKGSNFYKEAMNHKDIIKKSRNDKE